MITLKLKELNEIYANENGAPEKVFRSKAAAIEAIEEAREARRVAVIPNYSPTRSESIAASWRVPATARKRRERSTVTARDNATGIEREFSSVRKAFAALGLPDSVHIRYRMDIKAAEARGESLDALGYTWTTSTTANANPFCAR